MRNEIHERNLYKNSNSAVSHDSGVSGNGSRSGFSADFGGTRGNSLRYFVLAAEQGVLAQALEPRVANCSLSLTFDGTTAICEAICTGNSSTDQVKATIELYQGNTYLASWSNEETYFVAVSGQRGVTRGKSYTLKLTYTINGVAQPEQSVTKVCR